MLLPLDNERCFPCIQGHNEISPYRDLSRSIQLSKGAHYWSHVGKRNMIDISHLGGCKYLKLKWRKYDGLAKQAGGARKIFCGLFGDDKAENTFWLDSSSVEKVCLKHFLTCLTYLFLIRFVLFQMFVFIRMLIILLASVFFIFLFPE